MARVETRVARIAEELLTERRSVSPIDVLVGLGWLAEPNVDRWLRGGVPSLDRCVGVGSDKVMAALAALRHWAEERGLTPTEVFRIGLPAAERCAVIIDADDPCDTLSAIGTHSEIALWRDEGLLTVLTAPTSSRDDVTINEMLDVWDSFTKEARRTPTRIGGDAAWWLRIVSVDKLLEYEQELESSMPLGLSALCLYDRKRFDTEAQRSAMQLHPHKVTARSMFVDNDDYRV